MLQEVIMSIPRPDRLRLPLLLLMGFILLSANPSAAAGNPPVAGGAHPLFLPIVFKPPLVEQVVTSEGDSIGYPGYVWLNGYVHSLVTKPVFSVSIEVKYLVYPYCDPPEPCDPFEATDIVHPAFPAILPGQLNPYVWDYMYSKDSVSVVQAKVHSASLQNDTGKTFYSLTVLNWERKNNTVAGKVRNNSGKNLGEARVVVFPEFCNLDEYFSSNFCQYREATLAKTGLQAGQETDFSVDNFYYAGDDLIVVGQGSTTP